MKLTNESADQFIPDGMDEAQALKRVTHLGIGAHADDLEIMAAHGILECYRNPLRGFAGVFGKNARQRHVQRIPCC